MIPGWSIVFQVSQWIKPAVDPYIISLECEMGILNIRDSCWLWEHIPLIKKERKRERRKSMPSGRCFLVTFMWMVSVGFYSETSNLNTLIIVQCYKQKETLLGIL